MADTHAHHSADVIKATLIGLIAVFIWGPTIPLIRIIEDHIGAWGYLAIVPVISGLFGIGKNILDKTPTVTKDVLRNPYFYLRWSCYLVHFISQIVAINMVSAANLSLVILINYLWPTAVILCSVLLSAVRITHRWAFILGSCIVVISIGFELVGPQLFHINHAFPMRDLIAFGIIFMAAVTWGIFSAISRKYGHAIGGGAAISCFQLSLGCIGMMVYLSSKSAVLSGAPISLWLGLLALGALLFVALQAWNYGIHHGNIVALSLCADFIPWLSLISAHLFLHAEITPTTMIAAFALVVGAMITRFGTL